MCDNQLCFPARGSQSASFSGWSKAKAQLDKKISSLIAEGEPTKAASVQPWTLHDLRRSYCSNLQRLGVRYEVIERLVNHVSGYRSGVAGIYQRYEFWDEMVDAVKRYEEWFQRTIIGIKHD